MVALLDAGHVLADLGDDACTLVAAERRQADGGGAGGQVVVVAHDVLHQPPSGAWPHLLVEQVHVECQRIDRLRVAFDASVLADVGAINDRAYGFGGDWFSRLRPEQHARRLVRQIEALGYHVTITAADAT